MAAFAGLGNKLPIKGNFCYQTLRHVNSRHILVNRTTDSVIATSVRGVGNDVKDHKTSKWDKYMLVWMKKYPTIAAVPDRVSKATILKARDWARIKINIIMCILTVIGAGIMVYSGKKAAGRGESVHKMNVEWHKEINEQSKK